MHRLNILELHRTINEKKMKHNMSFEEVLKGCHKRIIAQTDIKKMNMFYEVPLFVIGFPLFDISECIEFLIKELETNGFLVRYFFPRYLYISWDFKEINVSRRKETEYLTLEHEPLLPPPPPIETRKDKKQILSSNIKKYKKMNSDSKMLSFKPSGKYELNLF